MGYYRGFASAACAAMLLYTGSAVSVPPNLGGDQRYQWVPPQRTRDAQPVTVQAPPYIFEMYFTALILQPFADNLDFAAQALPYQYGQVESSAISPSWEIYEMDPDFHFGFDLGVQGFFGSTASSLMLNWERYHSSTDKDSKTVPSSNYMIGPFFEIGPDASDFKKAVGKTHFHFDEINLDYGTFVNLGRRLHTNLFVGLSFGRIKQKLFAKYSNFSGSIVRTINDPSRFEGAGPQFGLDFDYEVYGGLKLVGIGRTSLFVGTFANHTKYSTVSPLLKSDGIQSSDQSTNVHHKMGVVPGFEGRIGVGYDLPFFQRYLCHFEVGYQAQVYLNSIRSVDLASEVALNAKGSIGSQETGVYARTFKRSIGNFALAGPYLKANFSF